MISAVCPNEIRRDNRRGKYAKFRRTKRYRNRVQELNQGKACVICGTTEKLTRHHIRESDYESLEIYFQALDWAVPLCTRHHLSWHKGKTKTCPICGRELISPEYECCWNCLPEEEKEKKKNSKEFWKALRKKWNHENYLKAKEAKANG